MKEKIRRAFARILPGLSVWDVRKVDSDINYQQVVGATAGFVLATALLSLVPFVRGIAARRYGYWAGEASVLTYKIMMVYLAILILAHWSAKSGDES